MPHNPALAAQTAAYIEARLATRLELADLAAALHYSPYHLHRVFRRTTGLTPRQYGQRRRLTEAARCLAFGTRPILEIALQAGYESQQAFTAACQAMYKRTPRQLRRQACFYALQLPFDFGAAPPDAPDVSAWRVVRATAADLPRWLALVRLMIDGFPHWREAEHLAALSGYLARGQAYLLEERGRAAGLLLLDTARGAIDFVGVHPFYRHGGALARLVDWAGQALGPREISVTSYRAGDLADTGQRRALLALGFAPGELLYEFGYPTQRLLRGPARVCGNEPNI